MFAVCAMLVLPYLVLAKHAGIIRHYKFDVGTPSHFYYVKHLAAFLLPAVLISVFLCIGLFQIKLQKVTRLCQSKNIVTVNGQFPGPRIIAREGDRVLIKVVNHVQNNITIHWYAI